MRQYLTFRLAGHYYGIDIKTINSVLEPQAMTPINCEGNIIRGLTNVRGIVVPIVDLRGPLAETQITKGGVEVKEGEVPDDLKTDETGVVVLETENGTTLQFIGIQVDGIGKVIHFENSALSAVPQFLGEEAGRFFEGFAVLGGVRVALLNLQQLLSGTTLFKKDVSQHRKEVAANE